MEYRLNQKIYSFPNFSSIPKNCVAKPNYSVDEFTGQRKLNYWVIEPSNAIATPATPTLTTNSWMHNNYSSHIAAPFTNDDGDDVDDDDDETSESDIFSSVDDTEDSVSISDSMNNYSTYSTFQDNPQYLKQFLVDPKDIAQAERLKSYIVDPENVAQAERLKSYIVTPDNINNLSFSSSPSEMMMHKKFSSNIQGQINDYANDDNVDDDDDDDIEEDENDLYAYGDGNESDDDDDNDDAVNDYNNIENNWEDYDVDDYAVDNYAHDGENDCDDDDNSCSLVLG